MHPSSSSPARRRRPLLATLAVSAALLAGLSGCGRSSGESGGSGGGSGGSTYKVGYIGPLSGALAPIGTSQLKALEVAAAAINADGGVAGRDVEIVAEDDANDPAKGIAAARSLQSDGVVAIVGPPVSSVLEAVLPTTSRADISILTLGATPETLDPAQRTLFQIEQTSSSDAQPMVDFALALLESSDVKVAAAPIDTPAGLAWGENVKELASTRGFELLSTTPVPVGASDITPQAQKILSGSPDVVLVEATDALFVTLVTKIRDLGYDGPIVNFHGGSSKATLDELADPDVYAQRNSLHYDEASEEPGVQRLVEAVQAADAVSMAQSASFFASAYLAGETVIAALDACGEGCDAPGLTDALNELDFDTQGLTAGNVTFTEDDHQSPKEVTYWHWVDDAIVPALEGETFVGSVYSLDAE